jgi:geranylgeranyl pyrophosphate synthase
VSIADIALDFLGRGGKKLRPRLCKAVFDRCGGVGDIAPVCEAVECFHKASLIHDDIQDGDETRYGGPTVWKEHGVAVAIAAGDWLVAHGYQLIAGSGFAGVPAMLAATIDSHVRLCEGQGDDLLGGGDYVSTCERKTGEAFALAAQLGALAAGADDAPFRRYALAYGVLFQINDDIADVGESDELCALKAEWEGRLAAISREIGFDCTINC